MADEFTNEIVTPETAEAERDVSIDALKAELERLTVENGKLKNAQSNASADASKYKKQLQERMTEQERAAEETKELIASLKAENEQMKRSAEVASRTAAYVGMGFDEVLAKQAAEAYGTNHEVFSETLKTFLAAHDKAILAAQMRSTPRPGIGSVETTVTKEQFDNMGYTDRVKLWNENPELYKKLNE